MVTLLRSANQNVITVLSHSVVWTELHPFQSNFYNSLSLESAKDYANLQRPALYAMSWPIGSFQTRWSLWYMCLQTGPRARCRNKFPCNPPLRFPLPFPFPWSPWLLCLSWTFYPSLWNTPLRLLALVPLRPKSPDPKARVGLSWNRWPPVKFQAFSILRKARRGRVAWEKKYKLNTTTLNGHPVKKAPLLNPDAHIAFDSCWAVKFMR